MKGKCQDYIASYDSGGNPIIARACYCGTTGCLNIEKSPERNKYSEESYVSPEEEKRFYELLK